LFLAAGALFLQQLQFQPETWFKLKIMNWKLKIMDY